jgi:hypothetical protein
MIFILAIPPPANGGFFLLCGKIADTIHVKDSVSRTVFAAQGIAS